MGNQDKLERENYKVKRTFHGSQGKEYLLKSINQSLKVLKLFKSTKGDSSLDKRSHVQPSTSTSYLDMLKEE